MTRTYRPNDDEAAIAWTVAKIRNGKNAGQTNIPGGETATKEQRLMQHYRAALAEIATSRLTNLCWTGVGEGASGLRDVGGLIEVRSIDDAKRNLLIRKKDVDKNSEVPFVLVLVKQDRACDFIGWAFPNEILTEGWVLDKDTENPAYILPKEKLHDCDGLLDLVKKVAK